MQKSIIALLLLLFLLPLHATITRTALGTVQNKTGSSDIKIYPSSGAITSGDLLVVWVAHDDGTISSVNYKYYISDTTGVELTKDIEGLNSGNVTGSIWTLANATGSGVSASITITFSGSAPTAKAAVASAFSGIATSSALDQTSSGTGSGTSPSSGQTGATQQADELLLGLVGTEGPIDDSPGTWDSSFNAGQRTGTTGQGATSNITVEEGYLVVASQSGYTASKSNAPSRDWAACIATYYAEGGGPPPKKLNPLLITRRRKNGTTH